MSISVARQQKCATTELKMLGDFWTLQIIQSLADGQKRFTELERALPGINPTTLTARLKKLMGQKIILRSEETVDKISVAYSLTAKGKGILPVLAEIRVFADRYLR
jgi:DNA-binding HxlR family transcriptional regulator